MPQPALTAGAVVLAAGILPGPAASATGAAERVPPTVPAVVTAQDPRIPHRLPEVITGHAPALHPQGVAWDPTRGAFLVGSIRHGTVSVVTTDGTVRTLISHPEMVSTTGVHVDRVRGRVLVGYADVGLGVRTSPKTQLRLSGVGIFDLATGQPLHMVDLGQAPGPHIATELAVDRRGNAYVTDIVSDAIYRIDPHGRASVLVRDPRFADPVAGLNGIVWHPAGYLLTVKYADGTLYRIPLRDPQRIRAVALDRPLTGGDGMALRRDRALTVVTNSLAGPGPDAVRILRGTGSWATAHTISQTQPWPDPDPTTVTITPSGSYVVSGRLRNLAAGQPADTFTLRRTHPRG